MSSGQLMTRVVMLGQTVRPIPYLAPTTPGFTPRPDETQEAFIGTYCRDNARRSTDRCTRAWDGIRAIYCREHAVDGWTVAHAKRALEKALTTTRLGPDGRKHKDVPSEATVRRYWKHLVEAGLIVLDTRIGLVATYTERVFLPGVLEAHGGIEAHADRAARRRASDRKRQRRRKDSLLPPPRPSKVPSLATCSAPTPAEHSAVKAASRPILAPNPSLVTDSPEQKDTSRPAPYNPAKPPPTPTEIFSLPPQPSIESDPIETEERRRTRVEPAEARLPLAPKTQPKPRNPAPSHDPPVQPPPPLRREAPPSVKAPTVAASNPHPPDRPAEAPKPAGYGGVRSEKNAIQKQAEALPGQLSAPPSPVTPRTEPPKPGQAALNAFLASQGLPPIPDRPRPAKTQMTQFADALTELPDTFHRQHVPDGAPLDPAERDMRRPWTFEGHAYDALCELKYRNADEATARKMLSPTAMRAVLSLRPWAEWMSGGEADVPLGWAAQAFDAYAALVKSRRADLRLPDGPPKDPVAMVRFLEAVTCPRATAYAFNGQAIVKMGLGAKALLSAVEQADEAFEKGKTGPGKAYARYFQGIAVRLAEGSTTG